MAAVRAAGTCVRQTWRRRQDRPRHPSHLRSRTPRHPLTTLGPGHTLFPAHAPSRRSRTGNCPEATDNVCVTTPRKYLVDPETPLYYHITSKCVQRAWLLGRDPVSGINYDHRRDWLIRRLEAITPAFAVSLQTYAIMSNHFHMVVYYDPLAASSWPDEEVARRWYIAHPSQLDDPADPECRAEAIGLLAGDSQRIKYCRQQLGSLSAFMKCLKQPIAERANKESNTEGHYWAKRFYSGAILSEDALLMVMAYVDLNPVRARITDHLKGCKHTGLERQIRASEVSKEALDAYLHPSADGLERERPTLQVRLREYLNFLHELLAFETRDIQVPTQPPKRTTSLTRAERWLSGKQVLQRNPRAIGSRREISDWAAARGLTPREVPLPAVRS